MIKNARHSEVALAQRGLGLTRLLLPLALLFGLMLYGPHIAAADDEEYAEEETVAAEEAWWPEPTVTITWLGAEEVAVVGEGAYVTTVGGTVTVTATTEPIVIFIDGYYVELGPGESLTMEIKQNPTCELYQMTFDGEGWTYVANTECVPYAEIDTLGMGLTAPPDDE